MNKQKLVYIVKNTRLFYCGYYYIGTFLLKLLRLVIKPKKNNLLFVSFGGKSFNDSPKAIYDALLNDSRFSDCNIFWGLNQPQIVKLKRGKAVKIDTLRYFLTALKCGCWITNSSVTRGLDFKPNKTFYLNTWHGTAIKKIEKDTNEGSVMFESKSKEGIDKMLVQSQYDLHTMQGAFGMPKDHFEIFGYPRNDSLLRYNDGQIRKIRHNLGIDSTKKIILYAPTFREYELEGKECYFSLPLDFEKWIKNLGKEYVLLFRAHYEVSKIIGIKNNEFIIDVSNYPVLNDLLIISDILISDYSSMFFDYSILHKPMLCFAYDFDIYKTKRGLYFDIRAEITNSKSCDELIENIINLDWEKEIRKSVQFQEKYITEYGHATEKCLNLLAKKI